MVIRLAPIAMLAGCLPKTYHCSSSSDCGTGVCEATGFCSYADTSCSTGQRYGDLSGSYTGLCVGDQGFDARVDTSTPGDSQRDAPIDTPAAFCDTTDATLIGCWEFENNVNDASGHNNNGVATSVTYAAGKTGQAAVLASGSHIAVADSVSLTPTQITIEGWIHPDALPASGRMGVLDGDGKYGFFMYPGQLECFVNVTVTATITFTAGTWTHVACTYDGSTGIIYIDGVQAATTAGGVALGAGSTNGIALGGNSPSADTLVGMIDQYRMFSMPRTAAQICRDAGLTTCP